MFIATGVIIGLIMSALAGALFFLLHRTRGEYFDADGVRIHYTVEGEGPPLLLIHGLAFNADLEWRKNGLIRKLAKEYRVIAFDLRGHGLSGKPHDAGQYGLEMVEDAVRLLNHLGIGKAHVMGCSMGGFIALTLTMKHPQRLRRVVLCAAGWLRDEPANLAILDTLVKSLEAGRGLGPLEEQLLPTGEKKYAVAIALFNLFINGINDQTALAHLVRSWPDLRIAEEDLRANTVPVLSVVGDKDPFILRTVEAMTGILANHEGLIIPGANHMSVTMRSEYVRGLRAFFAKG